MVEFVSTADTIPPDATVTTAGRGTIKIPPRMSRIGESANVSRPVLLLTQVQRSIYNIYTRNTI